MGWTVSVLLFLAASVTPARGFCGAHTHLAKKAELSGAVDVNTFGYFGEFGPQNWMALNPTENALCVFGTRQSPINMIDGQFHIVPSSDIVLDIPDQPEGIVFENLGTTIGGVMQGRGGKLILGGVEYELKQFHVHYPSEHIDNGTSIAMEIHNVFQGPDEQLAVIGVYVEIDIGIAVPAAKRDTRIRRMSRRQAGEVTLMPSQSAPKTEAVFSVLLETLFQSVEEIAAPGAKVTSQPLIFSELVETLRSSSFQAYSGSLTTPPCKEGVNWMIATQKLKVSATTIARVAKVVGFNSRFPQNLLGHPNILSYAANSISSSV
ncbi:alpha carbonic anhydrase [Xylariales sp. AK1849]|nr:alpha carbonic anhydrase [Xylariales sp. AK1849]